MLIRKMAALILCIMLMFCLALGSAACAEETTGGWEINQGDWEPDKNPDAKAAYENAMEGLVGVDYEPIAYLGSQVVKGTNHCFLCRATVVAPDASSNYVLVYVYEALNSNANVTDIVDIPDGGSTEEDDRGGWQANQGNVSLDANQDVKDAYVKAFRTYVGASCEAVAYIGNQVVQGMNYCVVCRETPSTSNPEPSFSLVYLYADLDGNAEITDMIKLNLSGTEGDETGKAEEEDRHNCPIPTPRWQHWKKPQKMTGFSLTVPDAPTDHPDRIIRVLDRHHDRSNLRQ